MSQAPRFRDFPGPFRASQLREGDPYELQNGHAIRRSSAGGRRASLKLLGAQLLGTDPLVEEVGVDAAYRVFNDDQTLRAPDVAVGNVPGKPGWIDGVPGLALEYADTGQDEKELRGKIDDLLQGGTRYVWVVRLVGPQRLEIYEAGKPMRVMDADSTVSAPGVLRNSYPVRSFFDREQTQRLTLRNLLQKEGYESLQQVRDEGQREGKRLGMDEGERSSKRTFVRELCQLFSVPLGPERQARIERMTSAELDKLRQHLLAHRAWDE